MQEISFKITELDIVRYLVSHKNDEAIKNREAMFVKYMKEKNTITQESLEILMKKYNLEDRKIDGTYSIFDDRGYSKQEDLSTFSDYLIGIENLDISGICHIMIPILSYYNKECGYHCYKCYEILSSICKKMHIEATFMMKENEIDAMKDNYLIGFGASHVFQQNKTTYFKFSKDKSRNLIQAYSQIYGEDAVKQIRKIIKERM